MQITDRWQTRSLKTAARRKPRGLSPARAMLLSLAAVSAGIWLSLHHDNWHWFARSGAVLVVIGILLTSSQIIDSNRRHRQRRSAHAGRFQHDYAEGLAQQPWPLLEEQDIWFSHLRGLYLLVSGTLIWGFGDLVAAVISLLST